MKVYITGRIPPVCHLDRSCFVIISNPREFETESLSEVPDHYEMCIFCNPLGVASLNTEQKAGVEELRELFKEE